MNPLLKDNRLTLDVPPSMRGWRAVLFRAARPLLRRFLAIDRVNALGDSVREAADQLPAMESHSTPLDDSTPATDPKALRALDALNRISGIQPLVSPQDLARIPTHGPLVVVSNHPLGGADPQALGTLLFSVRKDVRFIANRFLAVAPFLTDVSFMVDVFGGRGAVAANAAAMHDAVRWVAGGGCLCVFPAGEVAHIKWRRWSVRDSPWNTSAVRIAKWAEASILPVHVDGRNGALFQALGLLHPMLRTMRLPSEYFRAHGRGIRVRVGTPLSFAQLQRFPSDDELTRFLRVRSDLLTARRDDPVGSEARPLREHVPRVTASDGSFAAPGDAEEAPALQPVALVPQHSLEDLAAEVSSLPDDNLLLRQGDYEVYCTTTERIPLLMLEMGRLRELAFRAVGEGSGRSLDIDRFDRHYRQLFVWNARRQELVGAYRMGLTDEILRKQGIDGLYTSTLFEYSPRVLEQLGPAIELGRSYVRREYQRKPLPLLLLWRGIGEFVVRHPQYVIIFGPVSISDEYLTMSKKLMMTFLETHRAVALVLGAVRPRNPPRIGGLDEIDAESTRSVMRDVNEVDQVVRDLENGERAMPVLLRQYLRMNAKLIAFNVDPDFGNVVDALMFADIRTVHPRVQDFYLGREKAKAFRRVHGQAEAADARPKHC